MKRSKPMLSLVLLIFSVLSVWAVTQVGYLGIWQAGFASPGALQILGDLVVCCGLLIHWMVGDARRRGLNPWPWVVATLLGGSLVLLVYLLFRAEDGSEPGPAQA